MNSHDTWPDEIADPIKSSFVGALALHGGLVAAIVLGGLIFHHRGNEWGAGLDAHSIQATAVTSIPLPSEQPVNDNVLATDTPSVAPVTAPKTEAKPVADAVPIPVKNAKPAKKAEKTTPAPSKFQKPVLEKPNVAKYGEQGGMRMAVSTVQTKNGALTAAVTDEAFGTRFGWYRDLMDRRVSQNWYMQEIDPSNAAGRTATLLFDIQRSGAVSNLKISQRSGSPSCDTSAMRALQRIENFDALPNGYTGSYITVQMDFPCAPGR